ncbi:unnamed protein product [Taenia asiatica]|uniref:Septin n=1 Tax=Taenia asiatica TaxID=60517 RepID=A0A0R3W1B2_TAEAS|nr:unnamed protein product [Taenia asiatica]
MTVDALKKKNSDCRTLTLNGHVGFVSLPDQIVDKSISEGFVFNILCVGKLVQSSWIEIGETGLGKSTLIETLFNQKFDFTPSSHDSTDVKLKSKTYDLKEGNVKLKLTVTETCGFGDQINKENSADSVVEFLDQQYESYLQEELKIKRSMHTYHDTRVHVCLYFIAPTGHSLKSVDLVAMKKLQEKVNIIPIIAKSDTITKAELSKFKAKVMSEVKANGIRLYQFPTDDEMVSELNENTNKMLPFAVVGSTEEAKVNGRTLRVRQYPWGCVQVENEAHCDFVRLREMLLRVNMEDLRERTHTVHYETYRKRRLTEMGFRDDEKISLQETYEKRRETQQKELKQKEEEMRQMFVQRVKEKEQVLKETERELQAKFEAIKKQHAEERKKLEEKRRILSEEMAAFERRKQLAEQAKQGNLSGAASATMKKKK